MDREGADSIDGSRRERREMTRRGIMVAMVAVAVVVVETGGGFIGRTGGDCGFQIGRAHV